MAITVELGPELEAFVAELVEAGGFKTRAEAVREVLRLAQKREAKKAEMVAAINRGLADADAGRTTPADEVFRRLKTKYRNLAKQQRKQ